MNGTYNIATHVSHGRPPDHTIVLSVEGERAITHVKILCKILCLGAQRVHHHPSYDLKPPQIFQCMKQ